MNDEPVNPPLPRVPDAPSIFLSEPAERRPIAQVPRPPRRRLALILFAATCVTTFCAGTNQFFVVDWRQSLLSGLMYATAVMTMLGAHEMGHYLQARRYRVPASLPMFIPVPFGYLGTFGAVIVQKARTADRKGKFDIAISGPLAGLLVAVPLNWWGIAHSRVVPIQGGSFGWTNPLLVEWMIGWIHQPLKPGEDIALNPILFAGWVGLLVTALNLIPIGQLDGGHILYCLIGQRAHVVARALYLGAIAFVVFQVARGRFEFAFAWSLMLLLLWLMGTQHPPTANDSVPLGIPRVALGWLTLTFIFVGFVPIPFYLTDPAGPSRPPQPPAQTSPLLTHASTAAARLPIWNIRRKVVIFRETVQSGALGGPVTPAGMESHGSTEDAARKASRTGEQSVVELAAGSHTNLSGD